MTCQYLHENLHTIIFSRSFSPHFSGIKGAGWKSFSKFRSFVHSQNASSSGRQLCSPPAYLNFIEFSPESCERHHRPLIQQSNTWIRTPPRSGWSRRWLHWETSWYQRGLHQTWSRRSHPSKQWFDLRILQWKMHRWNVSFILFSLTSSNI